MIDEEAERGKQRLCTMGIGIVCLHSQGKKPLEAGHFTMQGRKDKRPKLVKLGSSHCAAEGLADSRGCVTAIQLAQGQQREVNATYHKCING